MDFQVIWPKVNDKLLVYVQIMSVQYILPPLIKSCHTWYSGFPLKIDDAYWFSGQMVKGQGQTTGLWGKYPLNTCIFDPFAGTLHILVQWMPLERRWFPFIFRSHDQRSRLNCWSLYKCCLLNIFSLLCLKLGTGCHKRADVPNWFSGHIVKGQGQNTYLHPKCCLLNNLRPFAWWFTKLASLVGFRDDDIFCFWGNKVKIR